MGDLYCELFDAVGVALFLHDPRLGRVRVANPAARDLFGLAPEEIEAELGYVLGGVAPFAPNDRTRVVLDAGVMVWPTIYCGTGWRDRTLEVAPSQLAEVARAHVAELTRTSS